MRCYHRCFWFLHFSLEDCHSICISSLLQAGLLVHHPKFLGILGESSVQFSHSVLSDSLWSHGLQHIRLPCPLPTPGACSNSCPLYWWCHPTISSCHPLLSSVFPSLMSFSDELVVRIRWAKYWSFSLSPSNEYSGLISFRIDWFDLLGMQGMLKNLLQHHSSKASIIQCWAFFMVQLSHPYMMTGKTIALSRKTFTDKVVSLLLIYCLGCS